MKLLGVFCWGVLLAAPVLGQVQSGRIVGTVYDPNQAVVPGAAVTVTRVGTNVAERVVTSATGDYVVTPLDPGAYNVSATAPGFQTIVKSGIELQVGQIARVDLELRLGETTTTVQVTAETPLLDTDSGTLGHVVTNTQIVNLPLNGRSFYELARLTPGAVILPGGGNLLRIRANFISGAAISGVRGRQTTFLLDGVDTTDHHQGGTLIQTSIDALQEFRVQQNAYTAEYSHAGGLLNATTKSGTNDVHAVLFEFLRNDKLDARNFFLPQRELLKRNQFGGTIGGPLSIPHLYSGKDRMFFLFSYEAMRERQGLVFNNIVPAAAMKQGDFGGPGLNQIYDPRTTTADGARTAFPNNRIPLDRLSPQALFFNKFIPDINNPSGTAVFAPSRALDQDQFTLRVDRKLAESHKFFARWSLHDNRLQDPNAFPALGRAPLGTRGHNVAASVTSTLRGNLIHEFRFNFLPNTVNLEAFLQGTDFNKQAGIRGFEDTARPGVAGSFPDFSWSGYASMNGSSFDQRPKTQDLRVYEWTDNLTWIKGKHILKFGGKIRHWVPLFTDSKQYVGNWSFNGFNTENSARPVGSGDAFADWMLGLARSVVRAFPGDVFGGTGTYWHIFAQDDLKVSKTLTLNLGVRYEYSPWLKGYRGQLGTFDGRQQRPIIIGSGSDKIDLGAQFAAPVAFPLFQDLIQTSSQAGAPLSITGPDKRQWAPRFGLAWRPLGPRTVLRGGYGIFYEIENTDGRVNLNMVPFKLDETVFNDRGVVPDRTMADFFQGRRIGTFATAPGMSPTYTAMRMGYDQHWNFGIQHELSGSTVVEIDYVGNKSSFLNGSNASNNPPAGPGPIQTRRQFPRFGSINYNSQDVSSNYHALQVKTERRASRDLWYMVSYSFSKSFTRQNTPVAGGDTAWERALSAFDVPHNFAVSLGYELPFGRGKSLLRNSGGAANALLGGWQMQGIFDIRSGRPFTPTVSRDVVNTGYGGQRPNRLGSGKLDHPTLLQWFDKNAFSVPANFTYGNSGGNILREDSFKFFDFSLFKQFSVTENSRLQFRAEFFNLTNTASFNPPNTAVDTASGGRVTTTASAPRQIQFGLKYSF